MKKIAVAAVLLLTGIVLTGCAAMKRAKIEERFSRISEVYPTAKAEELFKKFPKGFEVRYTKKQYKNDVIYSHYFIMKGDSEAKNITGIYTKSKNSDSAPENEEILRLPVTYTDEKGFQAVDGQNLEDDVKKIRFFFTQMPINTSYLHSLEIEAVTENPVSGTYVLYYRVNDKLINDYVGIPQDTSVTLQLGGNPKYNSSGKYYSTVSVQGDSNIYFFETITAE
ncbi:hypothetical protein STRDD11_01193 [Streptococcus sp. DD11]|uniref:Csa1 family protein n=1 Tax=Streptococcus sp. DD11 TaxID=1777879 RepID=UPI0007983D68|nr:Csa1 family protein [Streptococcus sp. DD11]KXT83988.1 hypothetical protein STRDD11_01193 [Streptococcus sp. DD11]